MRRSLASIQLFFISILISDESKNIAAVDNVIGSLPTIDQPYCREIDENTTYFCPVKRYCEWDYYVPSTRNYLRQTLGYNRRTWNYVNGQINEDAEETRFEDLNASQTIALSVLGFDKDSHDCCLNHYSSFEWDDFSDDKYAKVKAAWQTLGYNEISWTLDLASIYDSFFWDQLPIEARIAARDELCYTREIWNQVNISLWTNETEIPGSSKPSVKPDFETTSPSSLHADTMTITPTIFSSLEPTALISTFPSSEFSAHPSIFISPEPTKQHSLQPSSLVPSFSPSTNFVFQLNSREPCREQRADINYFCPPQRYCDWDYHGENTTSYLASVLDYTKDSWNYETNQINEKIELARFHDLSQDQRNILELFGYNEDTHDCCLSHFSTFDWFELFTPQHVIVASALILLGYDEESWKNNHIQKESPIYENTLWDDLPSVVRFSARTHLCYTRETWNQVNLELWPETAVIPGSDQEEPYKSSSPSTLFSLFPSVQPTILPTTKPTSPPTLTSSVIPSIYPSLASTTPPTIHPTLTNSNIPSAIPSITLPPTCRKLDAKMDYICPIQRYCQWNYYDFPAREFLQYQLGYNPSSWNYYEIDRLERTSFRDLPKNIKDGLTIFAGFDEFSHDCCHTHFTSYSWEEFDLDLTRFGKIKEAWKMFGYNQLSWDNDENTTYTNKPWDDLPLEIQTVLSEVLCYSRETWDMIPLTMWPDTVTLPGQLNRKSRPMVPNFVSVTDKATVTLSPSLAPCRNFDPKAEYWCPLERYCEWNYFDINTKQILAFQIGYQESDWNYETVSAVEETAFVDLNVYAKNGLKEIGFTEETHDCCHNHYSSYTWSYIETSESMRNVLSTFEMLGYDKMRWENNENSIYDDYDWDEIPNDVQLMLFEHLCYTKELWNGVPLTRWPEDVLLPGSVRIRNGLISSSFRLRPALSLLFFTQISLFVF